MLFSLTVLFLLFFVVGYYLFYGYKNSRNKSLYLKDGINRALISMIFILVVIGMLISIIIPSEPINLAYLQLHSDYVEQMASGNDFFYSYIFKGLSIFSELNVLGLFSAILILIVWYEYVRGLDFFKKEKSSTTILTLLLGMIFTFVVFPLSDIVHFIFDIEYSSNLFNNLFIYSTLGIGVIEEFVKLLPVLFILVFTKEIDEPIDFIYYASMSALGFAFIENLIYFREYSGTIVMGRSLLSVVGHMVDSTIVIYGFVLYYFNPSRKKFSYILYYFLLGAFVHGLYDYLIFENLVILLFPFFAFVIQAWAIMINNAINNSTYFNYKVVYAHNDVKFKLSLYLCGLIILGFLFNGALLGRDYAINEYINSIAWGGMIIIFYISGLSSFDLFKNYWRPVRFSLGQSNNNTFPGAGGFGAIAGIFTQNVIIPQNLVGKAIKLHAPPHNYELNDLMHITKGKIIDRVRLLNNEGKENIDWFLVKLLTPLNCNENYDKNYVLIRLKNKYSSIVHDSHIACSLLLIPAEFAPKLRANMEEYLYLGEVRINGADYNYKDPALAEYNQ